MPHIMLSYQWDVQDLAKKVFEKLEGLGFEEDDVAPLALTLLDPVAGVLWMVPDGE